jgi:hypothetical protein
VDSFRLGFLWKLRVLGLKLRNLEYVGGQEQDQEHGRDCLNAGRDAVFPPVFSMTCRVHRCERDVVTRRITKENRTYDEAKE